jgi:hypothetical protein
MGTSFGIGLGMAALRLSLFIGALSNLLSLDGDQITLDDDEITLE